MRKLAVLLLVTVLLTSGGVMLANDAPYGLPSLPPLPGIDSGDFSQGIGVYGISPSIAPNGFMMVFLGTQFPITVSQIDMVNWTTVRLVEWVPGRGWMVYNLSGWHGTGSVTVNFYTGVRGLHILIAWVDNNHNNQVEPGELTLPPLFVQVI